MQCETFVFSLEPLFVQRGYLRPFVFFSFRVHGSRIPQSDSRQSQRRILQAVNNSLLMMLVRVGDSYIEASTVSELICSFSMSSHPENCLPNRFYYYFIYHRDTNSALGEAFAKPIVALENK